MCYAVKPETIGHLNNNRDAITEIRRHTLEKFQENCSNGMKYCEASRGDHMNGIIFHF